MSGILQNFYHSIVFEYSITSLITIIVFYIAKKEISNFYTKTRSKSIHIFKSKLTQEYKLNKKEINIIINELNTYFKNEAKLYKVFENYEPIIQVNENYNSDLCDKKEIKIKDQSIKENGFDNEPHALLDNYTDLESLPITFNAKKTFFSTILCLREKNIKPAIISAGAILIDNRKKVLIVHKRSPKSATYPNHYHILGGAYIPKMNNYSTTYDTTLKHTVYREISEETNGVVEIEDLNLVSYRTFSKELTTGFIQYEFLGATVNIKENDSSNGNWEGDMTYIKFSDLEDKLINLEWVPSGKMHILAWLALGAPNSNYFKYKDAKKIYNSIINNINLDKK